MRADHLVVVNADDGDLVRHVQSRVAARLQDLHGAIVARGEDSGGARQFFYPCAELRQIVALAARSVHGGLESVAVHFVRESLAPESAPGVAGEIGDEGIRAVEPLREEVPRRFASDLFAVARNEHKVSLASVQQVLVEDVQRDGRHVELREFVRAVLRLWEGVYHAGHSAVGK